MSTPRFDPDAAPEPPTTRQEIAGNMDCVADLAQRIENMLRDPGHSLYFELLPSAEQAELHAASRLLFWKTADLFYRVHTLGAVTTEPPF